MDIETLIADLARDLQQAPGVAALVLGGSRARGTHAPHSDLDLALYYWPDQPLDLAALGAVAAVVDGAHRQDAITGLREWGPWINGGGWLTVQECLAGRPRIVYQPGHPHGFVTAIYLAETALCRVLWDPLGVIADLKSLATPYPRPLQAALIAQFFWEAEFALQVARKGIVRHDISYVAGCCFRSVSCLLQTLFALNECYWMNEKGAVALASTFPLTPVHLAERIESAFAGLAPTEAALTQAIVRLDELVVETTQLLPDDSST